MSFIFLEDPFVSLATILPHWPLGPGGVVDAGIAEAHVEEWGEYEGEQSDGGGSNLHTYKQWF